MPKLFLHPAINVPDAINADGITRVTGQLEIDHRRGVIYFHVADLDTAAVFRTVTPLRICQLGPVPPAAAVDISHMQGVMFIGGQRWRLI